MPRAEWGGASEQPTLKETLSEIYLRAKVAYYSGKMGLSFIFKKERPVEYHMVDRDWMFRMGIDFEQLATDEFRPKKVDPIRELDI